MAGDWNGRVAPLHFDYLELRLTQDGKVIRGTACYEVLPGAGEGFIWFRNATVTGMYPTIQIEAPAVNGFRFEGEFQAGKIHPRRIAPKSPPSRSWKQSVTLKPRRLSGVENESRRISSPSISSFEYELLEAGTPASRAMPKPSAYPLPSFASITDIGSVLAQVHLEFLSRGRLHFAYDSVVKKHPARCPHCIRLAGVAA